MITIEIDGWVPETETVEETLAHANLLPDNVEHDLRLHL